MSHHLPKQYPPNRILMGPGPSDVHPRVLQAMARPTVGHLDPFFSGLMTEIKGLLAAAFRTKNEVTLPISGPGSAGMEFCLVNLVEPGDKVVIAKNGVFGGRMADIVQRIGGQAIVVDFPWGSAPIAPKIEEALSEHGPAILAIVHAETSTGAGADAQSLGALAQKYNALFLADTVTSLGGMPLEVDEWQIDAAYSGSQKCLSCAPGLSPVTMSDRAVHKIKNRKTKPVSWFLDLNLQLSYWGTGARAYHHTAPVNSLYGLHEALVMLIEEEGLQAAWQRHAALHAELCAGLEVLGFTYLVAKEHRLPMLNAVYIPASMQDALGRAQLLRDYGIEVGAGLGELAGKIWRIGLMGNAASKKNVHMLLAALRQMSA